MFRIIIFMKAIEVENVSFAYNQETDALAGVSFAVKRGSYTSLIGHNGSGKSTIAKLIAGLLVAKSGSIRVAGKTMNEENISEIRRHIGIVFQNPDNQFIGSSVRDDIAFGLENYQVPQEEILPIVEHYATLVEMSSFLEREPEKLSGGQKQRVAIAGVLAMQPQILILDEATSMLDPCGKEEVNQLIRKLHQDRPEMTILSITHDIEEAAQSDDVIVMNKGKVVLAGKPEQVFKKEKQLQAIGLDVPLFHYVRDLFLQAGIFLKAQNEEGMVEELWQYVSKK